MVTHFTIASSYQVVKLTVDVTNHGHGTRHVRNIALIRKDRLGRLAESQHLHLCQVLALLHTLNLAIKARDVHFHSDDMHLACFLATLLIRAKTRFTRILTSSSN